ncbi:NAD(P)/FAD-dependent oxidoreductase [Sphingomonas crocodyli]|uniref:FAD-dependent oxidoreductase n=1 Tax=Sphingomonas crocodyli TaxID=1979270 RepID=A0A437M6Z1_9SPHN|nr:NAD(P)/FAD-dependent oxidoreductase [Sphingomonas crocodyli]RVT93488.1 FAD-dependent oxidoreductase [Sphingomonas crocodyli]
MKSVDLAIIGAGPAGMAAAITASSYGLTVIVFDEQPAPGGQIWRSVETASRRDAILGPSFVEGRAIAQAFRASGVVYQPEAKIWHIEAGYSVYYSLAGEAHRVDAKVVILATGAQERPVPFRGWTLPGVLTVGAAQILLKNAGQIPQEPVWIAGSGPLPLLYAVQFLQAGGRLAGFLDTTPPGQWRQAIRHFPRAIRAWPELVKGLKWSATLRRATRVIKGVEDIEAVGDGSLRQIRYRKNGSWHSTETSVLLIHEGVIPHIHAAMSLDCTMTWNDAQDCFAPKLDQWGESSRDNLFIVGDGAGIAGAKAALLRGKLAALRIAERLGRLASANAVVVRDRIDKQLARELAIRPFLDAMFKPRPQVFRPADEVIICRCEEVTAQQVRSLAHIGRPGPSQIKTATRCGMGPCQGRQCAYTLQRILAVEQNRSPQEVGFLHIRPPLKPVTLGELAILGSTKSAAHSDATEVHE